MQVQIAERGTSAKCVITGFNPTGEIWQGRSAIELDVRVTRPDGSVSHPEAARREPDLRTQLGMVVNVTYLPGCEEDLDGLQANR